MFGIGDISNRILEIILNILILVLKITSVWKTTNSFQEYSKTIVALQKMKKKTCLFYSHECRRWVLKQNSLLSVQNQRI